MFIDDYLTAKREVDRISEKTFLKYRSVLIKAVDSLEDEGSEVYPKKIGRNEILFLRDSVFKTGSPAHKRWQLSVVGCWLSRYGNDIVKKMEFAWPVDNRINVDWLEPEEVILLKNSAVGIEKLVIHLELDLGLRRIDMQRLTMQRVRDGYFEVLGKGKAGGKSRTVSWDEDTPRIFEEYKIQREKLIKNVQKKNPMVWVPDSLLIYAKGKRIGEYQLTAIDNIVPRVAKRAGIKRKITNHTLRRTCGRMLYKSGNSLVTIQNVLGHDEEKTTVQYLGLKLDDQRLAFSKKSQFLKDVEERMKNDSKENEK